RWDGRLARAGAVEVARRLRPRPRAGATFDRLDEARRPQLQLLPLVEPALRIRLPHEPVADVAGEEVADDLEGVQRRVERGDRELHLTERLAAERERRGKADAVGGGDADDPVEH